MSSSKNFAQRLKRSIAVILCTVCVITGVFGSAAVPVNAATTTIPGTITAAVNLRKGPTTEFAVVTSLSKGDKVQIKSRVWGTAYEVTATHNKKTYNGYVPAAYVKSAEVPESMERTTVDMPDQTGNELIGTTYYVNKSTWLRKSATAASAKVVSLSVGDSCVVKASGMGWFQVAAIHNGKIYEGCVYGQYLSAKPTANQDVKNKTGYVNYDFLNVRKKASASSKKLGQLYKSQSVTILSSSNGWYKVQYIQNKTTKKGFVSAEYISITSTGTMNTDVTLRKKASATGTAIIKLSAKTKVTVISEAKGWMKISCTVKKKTYTGFVMAEFVNM